MNSDEIKSLCYNIIMRVFIYQEGSDTASNTKYFMLTKNAPEIGETRYKTAIEVPDDKLAQAEALIAGYTGPYSALRQRIRNLLK